MSFWQASKTLSGLNNGNWRYIFIKCCFIMWEECRSFLKCRYYVLETGVLKIYFVPLGTREVCASVAVSITVYLNAGHCQFLLESGTEQT